MRPKKCPHLFFAGKLGKLSKIRKVHPENLESNPENYESNSENLKSSSVKLRKFSQIWKVPPKIRKAEGET